LRRSTQPDLTATLAVLAERPLAQATATPRPPSPDLPSLNTEPIGVALQLDGALNSGDVEGGLALFDPSAQVKVPPDLYVGREQIRSWLSYLAANHFAAEPGLRHVAGDTVTWPAEVRSDQLARFGLETASGTATLVVRDNKIASYTFVLDRESARRLREGQLAASDVLQDPLVVGTESANVYSSKDVFRTQDGTLISYRDVIGAEPGSGPFYDLGGQPVTIRTGI
jgi:hypothetical protein